MIRNKIVAPFTAEAAKLSTGEKLETPYNRIKDKKHISFTCDVLEMSDDAIIKIGHGPEVSSGSWIELSRTKIAAYNYYSYLTPNLRVVKEPTETGLEIKDFLTVIIDIDVAKRGNGSTTVIIQTSGGMVKFESLSIGGCAGSVTAWPVNCELENCKLNYVPHCIADPIWIFGDSYLGFSWDQRWPWYLFRDHIVDNVLLAGQPGMKTQGGLTDFKFALERGTPIYAVWCLGMNNNDGVGCTEPNPDWLATTEEFLAICKEKGITPILATIPSTPTVNNVPKSEWVMASGYRYIDFARAVSDQTYHEELVDKPVTNTSTPSAKINKTGYQWYDQMLFGDAVHPAQKGAAALYAQVLVDFPEIMNRF